MKNYKFTFSLPDNEALALAQFLKRVGWVEYRQNAIDDIKGNYIDGSLPFVENRK